MNRNGESHSEPRQASITSLGSNFPGSSTKRSKREAIGPSTDLVLWPPMRPPASSSRADATATPRQPTRRSPHPNIFRSQTPSTIWHFSTHADRRTGVTTTSIARHRGSLVPGQFRFEFGSLRNRHLAQRRTAREVDLIRISSGERLRPARDLVPTWAWGTGLATQLPGMRHDALPSSVRFTSS